MFGAWAREHNQDVFIEQAIKECHSFDNVIITDGRYENEFNALKRAGFHTLRIKANSRLRIHRGADSQFLNNTSEINLDTYDEEGKFDDYVVNESSLDDLYNQLNPIIGRLELKFLGGK